MVFNRSHKLNGHEHKTDVQGKYKCILESYSMQLMHVKI